GCAQRACLDFSGLAIHLFPWPSYSGYRYRRTALPSSCYAALRFHLGPCLLSGEHLLGATPKSKRHYPWFTAALFSEGLFICRYLFRWYSLSSIYSPKTFRFMT